MRVTVHIRVCGGCQRIGSKWEKSWQGKFTLHISGCMLRMAKRKTISACLLQVVSQRDKKGTRVISKRQNQPSTEVQCSKSQRTLGRSEKHVLILWGNARYLKQMLAHKWRVKLNQVPPKSCWNSIHVTVVRDMDIKGVIKVKWGHISGALCSRAHMRRRVDPKVCGQSRVQKKTQQGGCWDLCNSTDLHSSESDLVFSLLPSLCVPLNSLQYSLTGSHFLYAMGQNDLAI